MKLTILFDYTQNESIEKTERFFSDLYAFINVFLQFSYNNHIDIINNKRIIFKSNVDKLDKLENMNISPITEGDLNIAMLNNVDAILVCTMYDNNFNFINLCKAISAAKHLKIPIHIFCTQSNKQLRLLAAGTGGFYAGGFYDLIKILGTERTKQSEEFDTRCLCCNKNASMGFCCPICLAFYCKFTPICKKCKVKFSFKK